MLSPRLLVIGAVAALILPTAPGCTGGQSSDPGGRLANAGGPSDDSGVSVSDRGGCGAESWPDAQSRRRLATCEPLDDGGHRCDCDDGEPPRRTGEQDCEEALRRECGLDPENPDFCDASMFGACWPSVNGSFNCLCETPGGQEERAAQAQPGESCRHVLRRTCADLCRDDVGVCGRPSGATGPYAVGYACECGGDIDVDDLSAQDAVPTETPDEPCGSVLARACGGSCEASSGHCQVREGDGYDCQCTDGSVGRTDRAWDRPGCRESLRDVCGLPTTPQDPECTSSYEQIQGRCRARAVILGPGETLPAELDYDCVCGERTKLRRASSCAEALRASCPDAIPPAGGASSPLAVEDYGTRCSNDGECSAGACYVPGTGEDPICSKRCDDDTQCPSGTACAFGHCFVVCNGADDTDCRTLNDAIDNPLYCMSRDVVEEIDDATASADLCVPRSEP